MDVSLPLRQAYTHALTHTYVRAHTQIFTVICGLVCRQLPNYILTRRCMNKVENSSIISRSLSIYFRGDERSLLSVGREMSVGMWKRGKMYGVLCAQRVNESGTVPTHIYIPTDSNSFLAWMISFNYVMVRVIHISSRATCYPWRGKFTYGLYVVQLAHVSPVPLVITDRTARPRFYTELKAGTCEDGNESLYLLKGRRRVCQLRDCQLLSKDSAV